MKKIIAIIGLSGLFVGSNLYAADSNALTKAVVKLIKSYHELEMFTNNINLKEKENKNEIGKLKIRLTKDESVFGKQIKQNTENINLNKNKILINSEEIKKLREKISEIESTYKNANKMIIDSKNQVYQAKQILNQLSNELKKIKTESANSLYKSNISAEKANLLIQSLTKLSTDIKTQLNKQNKAISDIKNSIDSLKKELNGKIESQAFKIQHLTKVINEMKEQQNKKNIELSEDIKKLQAQIDVMKTRYDAEIKILKTKFDRTKPVYILDEKIKPVNCKDGKCKKTKSYDETINNFINEED